MGAGGGRKCDASFRNLDFAPLMVKRNYGPHDKETKKNEKERRFQSQPRENSSSRRPRAREGLLI